MWSGIRRLSCWRPRSGRTEAFLVLIFSVIIVMSAGPVWSSIWRLWVGVWPCVWRLRGGAHSCSTTALLQHQRDRQRHLHPGHKVRQDRQRSDYWIVIVTWLFMISEIKLSVNSGMDRFQNWSWFSMTSLVWQSSTVLMFWNSNKTSPATL